MRNKIKKAAIVMLAIIGITACSSEEGVQEVLANEALMEVSVEGYSDVLTAKLGDVLTVCVDGLEGVTDSEKEGLLLMREEELFAHDVYSLFNGLYELRIFNNITRAEATHAEAVLRLLNAFEIDDPALGLEGEYQNDDIQKLYDELTDKGKLSVENALEVGAYIEEVDIKDLTDLIAATSNEAILLVYGNLLRGSRNHLRAFNRMLNSYDMNYVPTILSQEEFDAIVNGEMERGNGSLNAHRNRYGQNNGNGNNGSSNNGNGGN